VSAVAKLLRGIAKSCTGKGFYFWKANDSLCIASWPGRCNHSGLMVDSSAYLSHNRCYPMKNMHLATRLGWFRNVTAISAT
jgi:hypothetical protein